MIKSMLHKLGMSALTLLVILGIRFYNLNNQTPQSVPTIDYNNSQAEPQDQEPPKEQMLQSAQLPLNKNNLQASWKSVVSKLHVESKFLEDDVYEDEILNIDTDLQNGNFKAVKKIVIQILQDYNTAMDQVDKSDISSLTEDERNSAPAFIRDFSSHKQAVVRLLEYAEKLPTEN